MSKSENKGFNPEVISEYEEKIKLTKQSFIYDEEEESSDEYSHFYFIGKYEGNPVIYDAVIYTLRLHHESEMFEIAEHRAAQQFPSYKKISYEEDENGDLENLDPLEEEIGLFMAEVILELEEEESVKVKEHIEIDDNVDFGVSMDIGLHVEKITPQVIEKFIKEFNDGSIKLDPTLYSYQTQDQSLDEE
jgi:hypothetical protein